MDACAGLYKVQTPGVIGLCDPFPGKNKKATRAFHALARRVFLQHEIDIKLRSRLFNALVVSVRLYNAETWVPLEYRYDGYTYSTSDAYEEWANYPERAFQARCVSPMRKC